MAKAFIAAYTTPEWLSELHASLPIDERIRVYVIGNEALVWQATGTCVCVPDDAYMLTAQRQMWPDYAILII